MFSLVCSTGAIYVFEVGFGGFTWSETAKLVSSDGTAGEFVGYGVSVYGRVICAVGAIQTGNLTHAISIIFLRSFMLILLGPSAYS